MEDLGNILMLSYSFIQMSVRGIWKKHVFLNFSKYLMTSPRDLFETDIYDAKFYAQSIELGVKSPKKFLREILGENPFFNSVFGL